MGRVRIGAACVGLLSMSGCATAVSLSAAPSVDTRGRFGTEERLQVSAAAGDRRLRFFVALGGGVGYLGSAESGAATISPELGVEGGEKVQWSASALYAPRFLFRGPLDVAHGGGTAAHVLFRVKGMGGESGSLLLGPKLAIEAVDLDPSLPNGKGAVALFSLALVVRWITFDTTAKSW